MIIWINGAFGAGKTTTAQLLKERLPNSFLYDPENLGYFLRDNLPASLHPQDFQDFPEWRTGNVALLKKLSEEYAGDIIVPMTLYKPHSVAEIIDRLKELQVPLCHFQLEVSESLLRQRLKERPDDQITWATQNLEQIFAAFSKIPATEKIDTEDQSPAEVVTEILNRIETARAAFQA